MAIKIYGLKIKNQARSLRQKKGLGYKKIADKLNIAKSTARLWCDNIILKPEFQKKLYTKQIEKLTKGPYCSHERRKKEIDTIVNRAEKEIKLPLKNDTYKLFGAALYWAEGSKTQQFAITNSDPCLIKFMVDWLEKVLKVHPRNIKAHLNIYPQQSDREIKKFWSDLTGIPLKNFGKSFVKPKNKNYKKNTLYYGTIKIRVSRGTDLRYQVFGWINTILKGTDKDLRLAQRKWHRLTTEYPRR